MSTDLDLGYQLRKAQARIHSLETAIAQALSRWEDLPMPDQHSILSVEQAEADIRASLRAVLWGGMEE